MDLSLALLMTGIVATTSGMSILSPLLVVLYGSDYFVLFVVTFEFFLFFGRLLVT